MNSKPLWYVFSWRLLIVRSILTSNVDWPHEKTIIRQFSSNVLRRRMSWWKYASLRQQTTNTNTFGQWSSPYIKILYNFWLNFHNFFHGKSYSIDFMTIMTMETRNWNSFPFHSIRVDLRAANTNNKARSNLTDAWQ